MVIVLEPAIFCLGLALDKAAEAVAALVNLVSIRCWGLPATGFRLGTWRGEVASYLGGLTGVVCLSWY